MWTSMLVVETVCVPSYDSEQTLLSIKAQSLYNRAKYVVAASRKGFLYVLLPAHNPCVLLIMSFITPPMLPTCSCLQAPHTCCFCLVSENPRGQEN